jgi:F-type H+-transporting ATPase subunit b
MTLPMLALLRAAETPAGAPASPFEVNGGLILWTLLVFGVLLYLLRTFAWPHIVGAVEAREKRLEEQIANTERLQAEAQKLVEQNQKVLAEARGQAQALLNEARAQAEKERAAAVEKTKAEQDDLLERARRDIASERDRAIADLRQEAVDLSLAAASKLVGERLDGEADRRIVSSYLASLGKDN